MLVWEFEKRLLRRLASIRIRQNGVRQRVKVRALGLRSRKGSV